MDFQIAVLPGDGIGPEVVAEGMKVLTHVGGLFGHTFHAEEGAVGGIAMDQCGTPLPEQTMNICQGSHAVLFGAVGGPRWDDPRASTRPEDGLLALRKGLGLFANLRPVRVLESLSQFSTLKPQALSGVDMIVVRELTGGLYFGTPKRRWASTRGRRGVDTMAYSEKEIERIVRVGFELAKRRRRKLTSVDKANILETSRLWREIASEVALDYPQVSVEHMLVDTCAMQLVTNPSRFDVIVTENTFGDILTDEAAVLAGSMGMLPSASLAGIPNLDSPRKRRTRGLYEPVHGSAPDISGEGKANPLATILSVAMLLRYSLALETEATIVEAAVTQTLNDGYRTSDIATNRDQIVSTSEMGRMVLARIER